MQECAATTAEETMEEIIPSIMSALSLNEVTDGSPPRRLLREQQQAETPLARNTGESIEENKGEIQPSYSQSDFCGTTDVDDIIPAIMNALSFQQPTEEIPRLTNTSASRRRPRAYSEEIPTSSSIGTSVLRRRQQQQQRQIDANDTSSILENLESSSRETKQTQKSNKTRPKEGTIEKRSRSQSFSDRILRRNNSDKSDIIPSIINTLSFPDTPEETTNNDSGHKKDTQIDLRRQSSERSRLRRRLSRQEHTPTDNDAEQSHSTITEEGSFMGSIREEEKINGPPSTKRISNFHSGSGTNINTTSDPRIDNVDTGFCSISEVFSMDGDDTKGEQNDQSTPLSRVYPMMRNVFSMNDVNADSPIRTKGELLGYTEKDEEQQINVPRRKTKPGQRIVVSRAYEVKEHYLETVFYVSVSAILGSVFRVYMARIFGLDCQYDNVTDFLVPFSSSICVTNDGRSEQTGGALFTDFPSNVFGSFLMGMITPPIDKERARFPWLHRDHPLQRDEVFHASLGVGFCGCLTTFASWNTQMVVMLDGTYCELGSQVVTVLFGYLIGLMGASYGYQLGRDCGLWMHNYTHRNDDKEKPSSPRDGSSVDEIIESSTPLQEDELLLDEGVELVDDDKVLLEPDPSHLHKIPLFLAAVALLVGFIIGDNVNGIEFYKDMTLLWVLSPVGSLLRWKLSSLNKKKLSNSLDWIPWGTLIANLLATCLSACTEGLSSRYFGGDDSSSSNQWLEAMLFALKTGVAGSLSTVSTLVKESVHLTEAHPGLAHGHYYSMLTCVSCCVLGLAVYSATIRIN